MRNAEDTAGLLPALRYPGPAPQSPALHDPEGWLARYLPAQHARIRGNRCALLRDGVEAFPAMLEAIDHARRTVRLETYMFQDDAVGELFRRALVEAAGRGAQVTVLYDAVGSWGVREEFFRQMRRSGVEVRPFRPLRGGGFWRRDHRKLLVVDGEVAFIGGINVASHWAPRAEGGGWRDDVLRVEGPAVRELERRFRASWRHQMRVRLLGQQTRRWRLLPKVMGTTTLCVLSSRRGIHRAYLHALRQAQRTVLIAAAYFVPDRTILGALVDAAARGVEVALLLNRQSDHPFLQCATRCLYGVLLRHGIRIFEWQRGVLHAKTAVVDGVWGTLGSFNLERWSLHLNHEANVVFADPQLGAAMEASLREDCGLCREVRLVDWVRRPLWQKALEQICFLFRRIL